MKRMNKPIRILCLVVSLVMILTMLSSCGLVTVVVNSILTATSSSAVDYEKMEYIRPDFEAIRIGFEELITKVEKQPNFLVLNFAATKTLTLYQDAMTMYALAQIRYYADINDTEAEEEINYCAEEFAKLDPLVNRFYVSLIENGYKDTLLYGLSERDFDYIEIRKKLFDRDYEALTTERTRLENEYMALSTAIIVYKDGEKEYTISECQKLYQSGEIDALTYKEAVNVYYQELAERSYPIYMSMVDIDNSLAAKAGYSSYADYSYKYVYSRDYTTAESALLAEQVKEVLVPLYARVVAALDNEMIADILSRQDHTIEGYDSVIWEYASEVSQDMFRAYRDLKRYNLSLIGSEEGMQQAGFTTYLYSYELPFMFIYTYGNIDDINTFAHEFGHFYAFHYNTVETDNVIDISEIQSQASEWLFLPYYDLTEEELTQYTLYRLSCTISNIIEGCLYDEFQQSVYASAHDLKTAKDVNDLFESIAKEYDYDSMYPSYDVTTLWSGIMHNFTASFYYISYAVSALPALEIYAESLEDRDNAIAIYNSICDDYGNNEFQAKLMANGLTNPFKKTENSLAIVEDLVEKILAAGKNENTANQIAA